MFFRKDQRNSGGTVSSRAAVFFLLVAAAGCASSRPRIALEDGRFEVHGVAPSEGWEDRFTVAVEGQDVPLFGDCSVEEGRLVFRPRYPLRPGLAYRAELKGVVERTFRIPVAPAGPPTEVSAVYPSADVLPENLLKFYLHFSAPMARGEAYRRIHLVPVGGKEVELPFLELDQELWDPSGTRLTVFFDPGRIKRGLKPREEEGPALIEGESYRLVIDRAWRDAAGRPLASDHVKRFRVVAPDDDCPVPAHWELTPPGKGPKDPLIVVFDEPLDEAMLRRVVSVLDPSGRGVAGRIEIDRNESRWRFVPDQPWSSGAYALEVATTLEDRSGNSIGRLFEVDVFRPVKRKIDIKTVRMRFVVGE